MGPETWLPQQLAELLAVVSHFPDDRSAIEGAIERAAEAVEAEIAAVIIGGEVVASIGFASGAQDDRLLLAIRAGATSIEVAGLGSCAAIAVPVDLATDTVMVLARSGEGFDQLEENLLRAVGRVVALVRRLLLLVESERCLRLESEEHARQNARLLVEVRDREALFERLFRIQQSISHRAPTQNVLDAITEGAAHLLNEPVAGLRLIDVNDPLFAVLVSSTGIDDDLLPQLRRTPIAEGVGGEAIGRGRLVVADDYSHARAPLGPFVRQGLQSAMAAPVLRDGEVVGSLAIASWNHERQYSKAEQEVLLALAEHASLALNDASARDAMRQAFDDALHQASHDSLTGLPNRVLMIDQLDRALSGARSASGSVGVLFIDLDRFKAINDSLGHSVGDEVLVRVAERLRLAVRPDDLVGRLAGDEFVVVCEGVTPDVAAAVAERAANAIAEPLALYGRDTVITASIGISMATAGASADDLLRDADVAMYRAKERGRSRVEMFDRAMRTRVLQRLEIEHALRAAIPRGELRLLYQPLVSVATGRIIGAEALVRWDHPDRGLLTPDEFIPTAEESGLVLPLGRWVLGQACRDLAAWQAHSSQPVRVAVNLSAREFGDPDLAAAMGAAAAEAGVDPSQIEVEITESAVMEDVEETAAALHALKRLGLRVSVDDFGTGYSSLSYLKKFPIDGLKIDRSFVDGLGIDAEDEAIVGAIVGMARALDLEVVAEGVETEMQMEMVRALGCDVVQGYLVGRPQSAASLARLLESPAKPPTAQAAHVA